MGWMKARREERAAKVEVEDALLTAMLGVGEATREMALQIPTVSGGIDLIAGLVAATPIKLYRERAGKAQEVTGDMRLRLLNDEPGDTLNANDFWRAMVRDYYLGKGGFAYIERRGGMPAALYYVDERQISIQSNSEAIRKEFDILVQGRRYYPHDFLRVLRNTRDGMRGVSLVEESGDLIQTAYHSLIYERNLVKKGGNKRGYLQSAKRLTDEALKLLKKSFLTQYSNNEENVVVLNDGVTFQESSNTSVEMQLNENKQTNAAEFAKLFHVPSAAIGGAASQADVAAIARLCAIPLMQAIQCSLNRDLLLEREKGRYYFAFDVKELLKGDMQSRFAAYKTALDANFMQIDEVRFAEDLEPLGLTWVKLGLNDVLYDPKTKQIYTPNTDKTATMSETALPEPGKDDTLEARARWTKGEDGKFTGSVSEGGAIDREYAVGDYDNVRVGSADNAERTQVGGFEGKGKERAHIRSHMREVGARDEREYKAKAVEFLSKPLGAGMDEMITKDGHRYRYDWNTNEYGVVNTRGNVSTYYKPKEKGEYWKRKVKDNGRKNV